MDYRAMQIACHCGQTPDRILEIGFTSERHMVVHFWCAACSRVLFISKPLDEWARLCPPQDTETETQSASDDARFLQSLGIAVS